MFAIKFLIICALFFSDLASRQLSKNILRNSDSKILVAETALNKPIFDYLQVTMHLGITAVFYCTVYQWLISVEILNNFWSKIGTLLAFYIALIPIGIRLFGPISVKVLLARTGVHAGVFCFSIGCLTGLLWILAPFWVREVLKSCI